MSSEGMQSPESNTSDDIEMQRLAANFTVRVKLLFRTFFHMSVCMLHSFAANRLLSF